MAIYAYVTKAGEKQYSVRRAPGLVTPIVVAGAPPETGFIGFESDVSRAQKMAENATFGGRALSWIRDDLAGNIESWRGERNP